MKPLRTAVFPVGGLGTRFLPATKAIPKEMLTVVDKPLIQYAVEDAVDAGIEHIIFVTGKGKSAIEDHFDRAFELEWMLEHKNMQKKLEELVQIVPTNVQISYTRQGEPKGLGHAVWCAKNLVGCEPFVVLLADEFMVSEKSSVAQMAEIYNETGANVLAVMDVREDETSKYGIIKPGQIDGKIIEVEAMVEKPRADQSPSRKAITGRYILSPNIFKYLESQKVGSGGEIQLTDAMADLLAEERFVGYEVDGVRFDCGSKIGFIKANLYQALNRADLSAELTRYLQEIQTT